MAELRCLSEKALSGIARQIGARLHDEFRRGDSGMPEFDSGTGIAGLASSHFELGESFEVWKLRAVTRDELAQGREDLPTLARPVNAWHNQIKVSVGGGPKKAVAYALTDPAGHPDDDLSVRDLFFSSLAGKIDRAITIADKEITEDAVVRLLSLPEFKVTALWFLTRSGDSQPPRPVSRVIVVEAPPSFRARGRVMSVMSSADFIRALAGARRGMGLLL